MDWPRAIEINRLALTRIVGQVFALLGLAGLERLPYAVYVAAERLLQPAESAFRRLLVIAARGIVLKPLPKRPMPKGMVIVGRGAGQMAFKLFDTRKNFDFITSQNPLFVRVETTCSNPFNLFDQIYQPQAEEPEGIVNALQLGRRLAALKLALENIPRQARRMVRWEMRRKILKGAKFTSPLRPGRPPGYRDKPQLDVDFILHECHALTFDALRRDSS